MALYLGNKGIEAAYIGASVISEMYLGDKLVYSPSKYIFRNGVLIPGATLNNVTIVPEGELNFGLSGGWGTGPWYYTAGGYIQFDVTNYSRLIVRGRTWCYGYNSGQQGNNWGKAIGLDLGNIDLPQGYRGWTGSDGEPAPFEVVLDSAAATGLHKIAMGMYCRNESTNWLPAGNVIRISEIIGES